MRVLIGFTTLNLVRSLLLLRPAADRMLDLTCLFLEEQDIPSVALELETQASIDGIST